MSITAKQILLFCQSNKQMNANFELNYTAQDCLNLSNFSFEGFKSLKRYKPIQQIVAKRRVLIYPIYFLK